MNTCDQSGFWKFCWFSFGIHGRSRFCRRALRENGGCRSDWSFPSHVPLRNPCDGKIVLHLLNPDLDGDWPCSLEYRYSPPNRYASRPTPVSRTMTTVMAMVRSMSGSMVGSIATRSMWRRVLVMRTVRMVRATRRLYGSRGTTRRRARAGRSAVSQTCVSNHR